MNETPPFKEGDIVRYSEAALLKQATWPRKETGARVVKAVYQPVEGESKEFVFSAHGFSGVALCKHFERVP